MTALDSSLSIPQFTSRSLRTAAYLRASGFPCAVTALDGKQALFSFDGTADVLAALQRLERDEAMVSPRAFDEHKARLRREIDECLYRAQRDAGGAQ